MMMNMIYALPLLNHGSSSDKIPVNLRIRLFLFCLIEAGFIILASACLARLLPITLRLSDSKE